MKLKTLSMSNLKREKFCAKSKKVSNFNYLKHIDQIMKEFRKQQQAQIAKMTFYEQQLMEAIDGATKRNRQDQKIFIKEVKMYRSQRRFLAKRLYITSIDCHLSRNSAIIMYKNVKILREKLEKLHTFCRIRQEFLEDDEGYCDEFNDSQEIIEDDKIE